MIRTGFKTKISNIFSIKNRFLSSFETASSKGCSHEKSKNDCDNCCVAVGSCHCALEYPVG